MPTVLVPNGIRDMPSFIRRMEPLISTTKYMRSGFAGMERDTADALTEELLDEMRSKGYLCHLAEKRELKTYSPSASVYVFDVIRD